MLERAVELVVQVVEVASPESWHHSLNCLCLTINMPEFPRYAESQQDTNMLAVAGDVVMARSV
jgi:hypothetical protein